MNLRKYLTTAAVALGIAAGSVATQAHTVSIAASNTGANEWTFFAANYHGASLAGGLIVNGSTYNFTTASSIGPGLSQAGFATLIQNNFDPAALFVNAPNYNSSGINAMQVVTVNLADGAYNINTTCTSAIECPWPGHNGFSITLASSVPVPATLALAGLGLLAGAWVRRRKA